MAHKDFGAARREARPDDDPITFSLGGETFTVPEPFPALPLMDLASLDPETDGPEAARAFRDCLLAMLDDGDHSRFRKACAKVRADSDLLGDIVKWVLAEVTGRPTRRRSSSGGSPSSTGPSSSGDSPAPEPGDPPEPSTS